MRVIFRTKRLVDTENGFVRLEALASNIYIQSLGYEFDDRSAHSGIPVKPSTPPGVRSLVQLRPGEGFYIGKGIFDLVPEEHNNLPVSSSGPSMERYESQVSQINQSSSPSGKGSSAVLESHQAKPTGPAPLVNSAAEVAMTGKVDTQNRPEVLSKQSLPRANRHAEKQTIAETLKEDGQLESPLPEQVPRESSTERHQPHEKPGVLESEKLDKPHTGHRKPTNLEQTEGESGHHTTPPPLFPVQDHGDVSFSSPANHPDLSDPIPGTLTKEALIVQEQTLPSSRAEDSQDSLMGTICVMQKTPENHDQSPKSRAKGRTTAIDQGTPHPSGPPIEPTSSLRSTRSVVREDMSQLNVRDDRIRILFSSSTAVGDSRAFIKFLSQQGIEKVQSVSECTVLCVGKGELKKTSKLIMAVMLGKEVITDDWVTESARCNGLQSIEEYIARDPEREDEWGFNIRDAIHRGRQGLKILQDWTVIFTASAKKEVGKSGFSDLKDIATFAGAKSVLTTLPKQSPEELPFTLIIGTVEDVNSPALGQWKFYTRDIIGLSVLRGRLEIDSEEFLIPKPKQEKPSKKRKR